MRDYSFSEKVQPESASPRSDEGEYYDIVPDSLRVPRGIQSGCRATRGQGIQPVSDG